MKRPFIYIYASLLILYTLYSFMFEYPLVDPIQNDFPGKWQNEYGDSLIFFDNGRVIGSGPTVSSYSYSHDLNNTEADSDGVPWSYSRDYNNRGQGTTVSGS